MKGNIFKIQHTILSQMVILLFVFPEATFGQGRITGFVHEEKTNRPLEGANVVLIGTKLGAATGEDGSFLIMNVPEGVYTIEVSFLGYKTQKREKFVVRDNVTLELKFELAEAPLELKEVIVSPSHFSIRRYTPTTRQIITREEIQSLSLIEGDVYRAVSRLPGVVGNDFSSKFAIRGGGPDEVLVLFDGLELYEPFHLKDIAGGVMSIIDMEAIESIDLMTGGFTADYGDKMSGVFNIHSSTTPLKQKRTSIGISLLNARIFSEGKFKGEKGSWILSARRGYMDLMMRLIGKGNDFLPEYYDFLGKINYKLNENNTLTAHFLRAGDTFKFVDNFGNKANTGYGNTYGWITLKSFLTKRLFTQSLFSTGRVDHNRNAFVFYEDESIKMRASSDQELTIYNLKQDWNFGVTNRLFLKWGFDVKQYGADYDYFRIEPKEKILQTGETIEVPDTTEINIDPGKRVTTIIFLIMIN